MEPRPGIYDLMQDGGWVMWILLVFSIAAVATAIERLIALRRADTDLSGLVRLLEQSIARTGKADEALKLCQGRRGAAVRVARAGLRRFAGSTARLEKTLERHGNTEVRRLRRRLGVLATVAGVAPLLGFLGTVTGMIFAFGALHAFGTTNPGLVALGIKEALTTTAAGLVVAVPAQLAHNALAARAERIAGDIETVANTLLELRESVTPAR